MLKSSSALLCKIAVYVPSGNTGDPLTVVIWTAHRRVPANPRFAQALQPEAPALVEGELH